MYRLIGKMVADGGDVPGRRNIPAGTVLYKVSVSMSVSVGVSVSVSVTTRVTLTCTKRL